VFKALNEQKAKSALILLFELLFVQHIVYPKDLSITLLRNFDEFPSGFTASYFYA
jgi:hypothetical protein